MRKPNQSVKIGHPGQVVVYCLSLSRSVEEQILREMHQARCRTIEIVKLENYPYWLEVALEREAGAWWKL